MAWEMQSAKPPKSYMSVSFHFFNVNIILFNNGFETHYQCQDRKKMHSNKTAFK